MITLATLEKSTEQEVFDQIATHLLKQGKQSYNNSESSCMYRGENGTKCAAGCLISDDEYKKEFEGESWNTLVDEYPITYLHENLILGLQDIHDSIDPKGWKEELTLLASNFKLNIDCFEKL